MFNQNGLQFSVVREDPEVELEIFRRHRFKKAALIGSGGCTILTIAAEHPVCQLTVIEPNPSQIALIKTKIKVLNSKDNLSLKAKFGIGFSTEPSSSLIERGNFESLFRGFRNFIFDFIADRNQMGGLLEEGKQSDWKSLFNHPYWPVAFDLYFSNSLLRTMFGEAAIQHAPPNSYPSYFRSVLEKGLLRPDRKNNYFLYHILLGHYPNHPEGWPTYLRTRILHRGVSKAPMPSPAFKPRIRFFQGFAQDLKDYSNFDFVDMSNIFDWSSQQEVALLASKISGQMKSGAILMYRQLNNTKNFRPYFGDSFRWLDEESSQLHKKDRSLFYSSIHIGRKNK